MEWEKKGHEEKQLDNYLSGVGKATGIPGDTRISNNCLLITDIFPSCFLITSVWVLSVGPLHWPGRRGLQGGPGSVPVILPCGRERDTSGMAACCEPRGTERAARRERRCRTAGLPSGAEAFGHLHSGFTPEPVCKMPRRSPKPLVRSTSST